MIRLSGRNIRVELYPGEPKLWVREGPEVRADLERRMSKVQRVARARVRVRTGTLLSTIRKNGGVTARGVYVDVIAGGKGVRYVGVEEFGSAPHRITVRNRGRRTRRSLRFTVGGQVVFRRSVQHPGTTGTFFLTRSLIFAAT